MFSILPTSARARREEPGCVRVVAEQVTAEPAATHLVHRRTGQHVRNDQHGELCAKTGGVPATPR
jgi:hypothetical protein